MGGISVSFNVARNCHSNLLNGYHIAIYPGVVMTYSPSSLVDECDRATIDAIEMEESHIAFRAAEDATLLVVAERWRGSGRSRVRMLCNLSPFPI